MTGKRKRPHRDILDDLEAQGKTLEMVLLAWGIVELYSSDTLFKAFLKISGKTPNWEWILNMQASTKLRILKQMGNLTDSEFGKIWAFKKKRDELAHTHGLYFPNYSKKAKDELSDLAIKAVDAIYAMFDRIMEFKTIP